jgi:hypothetical protein
MSYTLDECQAQIDGFVILLEHLTLRTKMATSVVRIKVIEMRLLEKAKVTRGRQVYVQNFGQTIMYKGCIREFYTSHDLVVNTIV